LLGALNLKEAHESSLNSKPKRNELDAGTHSKSKMAADKSKSIKSKSEFILQNVDKYPPSPQLMTLVNLSKNLANSGRSPSTHITGMIEETTNRKCSEIKETQKPRETPQGTIFQGRTGTNSKRMSLSTPRRQKHVRTLDFTTPPKARTVPRDLQPEEPSPKTIEKLTKTLQRTTSSAVNKARSSLFRSPRCEPKKTTVSGAPLLTTVSSFSSACSDNCLNNIPPIATRSPLPQLSGGWDSAAGVGQIICDDITMTREARLGDAFGSNLPVTETQNEKNLSDKQSEITERTTSPQQNRETGHKVTPKRAEGSWMSSKSSPCPKKLWDSDLRALVNADYGGDQLPINDSASTKKTTKKRKTKTTKLRRKSSQMTEEEVRSLEECLHKDTDLDNGGTNLNQESTNGESENILSSLVIPVNKSLHSSEKADLDTEAETQNRDLNIEGAVLVKGKSDLPRKSVEPASGNDHTHVELNEKLSVKFNRQSKKCVSVDKLNEKKDANLPTDLPASRVEAVKKSDGEDQETRVQRKENFALEIAASNKVDLSKSSDSSTIETVSSSTSVVSVLTMAISSKVTQSPAELETAEKKILRNNLHIHQSSNCVDTEMIVIHTDDPGNDTDSVAHASGIGCELKGGTVSVTDDQHVPVSQSQELASSTSGFYPTESQNKDLQTSHDYKSISSKEPCFAKVPGTPPSKMSRTQKQVCDAVNKSDLQARSVIAPILDTPRKTNDPGSTCWGTEFMHIPLTPRMMSPRPDDTPITKLANENSCIDFSLIQTPSFPPTPNIAVTPQSCSGRGTPPSYATRSTDCSSCSSYYKPSGKLDSWNSAKPLEELLIEECRKLENRTDVQTSCAYNESGKENASECADIGQCQPLSVTDKTPEEATPLLSDSVTDFQVTLHVGKELVPGKAAEGEVDSLVGAPKRAPSPQNQKQEKEMTQKIGVTDHGSNTKSEETNIATRKKARSVFSCGNRDIDMKDRPLETYTSVKWKAGFVSLIANKSSDVEGKSFGAQTSASVSARRKSLSISKTGNTSSDFEDKLSETCTSASVSAKRKSMAISKTGNTSTESEDKPSETHALASVSTKKKAGTANKSSDCNDGPSGTHALTSIATKRKARPISRPANKSSYLEDELPETQMNLCNEPDEKTKDEIIQKHLEAARMKLFGCNSPSDDSDFESSNDFGQSEAETKTVSSNDGNNKRYRELTEAKQSATGQEERDTVGKFSQFCSTFTDDSNTDTQQMVAPQRQTNEVRPLSRLALMKEKSPCVRTSACGAQIRKLNTDENVNCEALSYHSKIPGDEILSEHDQPTDDFRKFRNDDSAGTKSHTSLSARNTTLNSKLVEEKHFMIAELKGIDVPSIMPNTEIKEPVEQDGGIMFTVKTVPEGLGPSTSIGNNPTYVDKDMGARKQLREKEDNLAKTSLIIPKNRRNDGETMQAKKNSHLSVEAIAERLTKEKIAVQAHPMTKTPVCESLTCENSSSEDFPALHLSSDDETQSESIHLSQVESQMAKLHWGEETAADVLTVSSTPRSAHDVYKDLELTPIRFRGVESSPKLLQAVDALENEGQELPCEKQSNTSKCKEGRVSHTSVYTNDPKTLKKELNPSERQESTNKKIRALLGNDVSPVKNLTEARKACEGTKREILRTLLTAAKKHNSPIKSTLEIEMQEKKLEESLRINSAIKKVQENEVVSKQNKVSESNKMKKGTKSYEACTNEESDSVECRTATLVHGEGTSVEGMSSLDTAVMYERHQLSNNEAYIGIVYADEGPKGNSLVFEDICNFSLTFELDEDPDGVVETYKCTVSEFQELFYASPRQCTSESNSYESGQFDVKRKRTASSCKEDKHSGYVKSNKVRDKEFFNKGRSAGLYTREHQTRSRSQSFRRSTDFSNYRMRTSRVHRRSPSPVHRRRALSSGHGRRSQSLDRRLPSSSPVSSTSRVSTFSPLNQLYSDYLRDERESVRFASHCNKGDRCFNFRSSEKLSFGQRGRGKAKYHDRHIHSKRAFVHSSCRESSHTSSTSSSSSYGIYDSHSRMLKHFKELRPSANTRSTQEGRPIETCSRRLSSDTALLVGMLPAAKAKDAEKERATAYTQIKDAVDGRQKMQDTDESLEEGELVDEDSMQGLNKYECNDKLAVWLQKYSASGNFTRYLVQIAQISL
jgi:hypothetical protein